jgi:hypothetical protein
MRRPEERRYRSGSVSTIERLSGPSAEARNSAE